MTNKIKITPGRQVLAVGAGLVLVAAAWLSDRPQPPGLEARLPETESVQHQPVMPHGLCSVDVSASPDLTPISRRALELCNSHYARIGRKLVNPAFKPGRPVRIVFSEEIVNMAQATHQDQLIELNSPWMRNNPEDVGIVIHELTHLVQAYPEPHPDWLREGLATYMQAWSGVESSESRPRCDAANKHYRGGYACAAALLRFTERRFSPDLIPSLNARLKSGRYQDSAFKEITGLDLDTLWDQCQRQECKLS